MPRYIKTGATNPALTATLQDASGAVDLSTSTAKTVDLTLADGTSVRTAAAVSFVTDGTDGRVTYAWQEGDTDVAGELRCEFNITWGDGTITVFPDDGYGIIFVVADI